MISIEEAKAIIDQAIAPTANTETVPLYAAGGRALARDVACDIDIPPFNRVTMDGYAVVAADGPGTYEVIEDVPAGVFPKLAVTSGKVSKIMTGAPLPEGADAVAPVEKTSGFAGVGEYVEIHEGVKRGNNFCPVGEDMKKGERALRAGVLIRPPEVATLASMGADPVTVFRRPGVAILATGDELVAPSETPGAGQIRNSNEFSTFAQARAMGLEPVSLGVAGDDPDVLGEKIEKGSHYDFLLISGGVSAGDRDFVPGVLKKFGYELKFDKIRIKPGKPVTFGVSDKGRYVFGVPGNPVSSIVAFDLLIRPAIRKFSGFATYDGAEAAATLAGGFKRKYDKREEYVPVRLFWEGGVLKAAPVPFHGSGHFAALTHANGLIIVPIGVQELPAGETVRARFFADVPASM